MGRKSTLKWLWNVTGSRKGYILALTLIQGILGATGVLYALFLRAIVDSAVSREVELFRLSVIRIIILVVLQLSLSAAVRWLRELGKADIENTFKARLLENILSRDYSAVASTHTAEWLNRLTNDTTVVSAGAIEILPGLFGTVIRLVSALVMIIVIDRWFAYVLIPAGIFLIIVTCSFRGVLKRLHKDIQESDGRLRIFLQERISNLMLIKAFSAEEQTMSGAGTGPWRS